MSSQSLVVIPVVPEEEVRHHQEEDLVTEDVDHRHHAETIDITTIDDLAINKLKLMVLLFYQAKVFQISKFRLWTL